MNASVRTFLHVGCGPARQAQAGPGFRDEGWREIRFDIDPSVSPDLIGTMTDMAAVADAQVDAVYSSHNIEHLYAHEVPRALGEFWRVLKPDGFAVITCPDLQAVARLVAGGQLNEPAYTSALGPISPHDMLYGSSDALVMGRHHMAHRCGFTLDTLVAALQRAGFGSVAGVARSKGLDLWVVASKTVLAEPDMRSLAATHLPT